MRDDPNYDLLRKHIMTQFGSEDFLTTAQAVGVATRSLGDMDPTLKKIVHDIRAGG